MRYLYIILIFIFSGIAATGQEIITGLQINPVIRAKFLESGTLGMKSFLQDTSAIGIPFYDDFTSPGIYPSPARWADRFGYVNDDYPVYPVDRGVLTMDAISDSGSMYSNAIAGPSTFIADHLTSRYIRLDSLFSPVPKPVTVADSIYLSFYYQPQGRGLAPLSVDSLVLEFLVRPAHDTITATDTLFIPDHWKHIWSAPGMSLDTFYLQNNKYFKRVMIPILDSALFYKNTFRFRFYNYVSLATSSQPSWQSNTDQWNIDDIYLNAGRTWYDTIRKSIRFVERAPSFLANMTALPNDQYANNPAGEMADSVQMLISNRDTVAHNSTYSYTVNEVEGSFTKSYSSTFNLTSYYQYDFPYTIRPPIPFLFPITAADSASYLIRHIIRDNTPGSVLGDTISSYQNFYNYYSYDDGTPEAGYGLKGAFAMLAYRFLLFKSPDTLRAVRIFFNPTLSEANQQFFYLVVWNDHNGKPGDTIYSNIEYVRYPDTINKFVTYHLTRPLRITSTFYVGVIQTTDDNLNIGFDKYDDAHQNIMYNVIGQWLTSSQTGSLLMRPVLGKPIPVGIPRLPAIPGRLLIYPNPATTGSITVEIPSTREYSGSNQLRIKLVNVYGQVVYSGMYSRTIHLADIPAGIYLVEVSGMTDGKSFNGKLIITK